MITIQAKTDQHDIEVNVYETTTPGLSVGKAAKGSKHEGWFVYHTLSGIRLGKPYATKREAKGVAEKIAPETDWEQSAEAIMSNSSLVSRMREVLA